MRPIQAAHGGRPVSVARFTAAGHGDALPTLLEVLEQEAEDRRHRRINRLRRESKLPSGKTWETFEHHLVSRPGAAAATGPPGPGQLRDTASTSWPSDCPAPARPTPCVPWATAWWKRATPSSSLRPTAWCRNSSAAKRDLDLPRRLRKLDNFDFLLLDDLGYLPQGAEESEVLFTLIAERYERRVNWHHLQPGLLGVGAYLRQPHGTAAAIDRVVHHSVILEFDVPSYRTDAAQQRGQAEEVNRQK